MKHFLGPRVSRNCVPTSAALLISRFDCKVYRNFAGRAIKRDRKSISSRRSPHLSRAKTSPLYALPQFRNFRALLYNPARRQMETNFILEL